MRTNNLSKSKYVTVRIPRELADEIDNFIESGTRGYRSRAEFVNESIRVRLESLQSNNPKKTTLVNE